MEARIILPLHRAAMKAAASTIHPGRMEYEFMARLKPTILCIDDHWNGLIGRKMLLEKHGYEVLEATGGDEGLKLFLSRSVDAVVIDYQMPGMNGDVDRKSVV